jgi:hypothetical protein
MSDFFTRLAARSTDPPPEIRPRLTGLFEPPPVSVETPRSRGLDNRGLENDGQPSREQASLARPAPAPIGRVAHVEPAAGGTAIPPASPPHMRRLSLDASWPPPREAADPPVRTRSQVLHPDSTSATDTDRVAARAPRADEGGHRAPTSEPVRTVVTGVEALPAGTRPLIGPRPGGLPVEPAPDARLAPREGQPRVTPVVRPADRGAAESQTPPDARPVIRVTIGRIDVRAVMPPAPPAPTPGGAPPRPALTLEAYLSQRNEGRR